jgi:hypothetical protein
MPSVNAVNSEAFSFLVKAAADPYPFSWQQRSQGGSVSFRAEQPDGRRPPAWFAFNEMRPHIGDVLPRLVSEAGQQALEEALRCRGIPPPLDQDVEHAAVLVRRTPGIVPDAIDAQKHLIEVPGVARLRPPPPQLPGEGRAKLLAPIPNAFRVTMMPVRPAPAA